MEVSAEVAWVTAVLLVSIRISALFLLTPLFAVAQVPVRVRVILTLAMAVLMVASLDLRSIMVPLNLAQFFSAAIVEFVLGAMLAFGVYAAFAAFLLGGRIIDMQMGFGVASLIDPATRSQAPLLGTVLNLVAVMVFFAIDGHHLIIRGLAFSLSQIPPGSPMPEIKMAALLAQFGGMFTYGLAIVAPVVFTLLLLDAGLGVMARTMPQMNVFIVSLPIKIMVGLIILAISMRYLSPVMKNVFQSMFGYWERILN